MGAFDRLFGVALILAGVFIAVYYTAWVAVSITAVREVIVEHVPVKYLDMLFFDPAWLFKLPALTLIFGLVFIWWFIVSTNNKIARAKAEALVKAQQAEKKKQ